MLVAFLASALFVILSTLEFVSAIIVLMLVLEILFLYKVKPFIFNELDSNKRSGMLIILSILNQLVLLTLRITTFDAKTNPHEIIFYLPILISISISLCITYSIYCMYFKLR
jgi:hypothetical protein